MKRKNPSAQPATDAPAAAATGKRPRRGRRILLIVLIVLALLAAVVLLLPRLLFGSVPEVAASSAQSTEVTTGTVTSSIVGTGSLTAGDTESVELPSGLVIDEVYVSAGDAVQPGDALASVTDQSLSTLLQSLQTSLDSVDEELEEALEEDEDEEELETALSGRVIKLYAAEGDSAARVVAEHGALLLLSVDGKMALRLEDAGSLAVGDEVTVTLSDGTEKEGTVESVSGGAVITIGDKGTELDETVTVTDADGNELGSAALYIHQEIAITAVRGTVADLEVEEGDAVDAGDTLCTLEGTGSSAAVLELTAERADLQSQLQSALRLAAQGGVVTAPSDGVVQAVNVSASGSSTSTTSSTAYAAGTGSFLSASSDTGAASLVFLSAAAEPETPSDGGTDTGDADGSTGGDTPADDPSTDGDTPADDPSADGDTPADDPAADGDTPAQDDPAEDGDTPEDGGTDADETADTVISDFSALTIAAPVTGGTPQAELAETEMYTGAIVWQTQDTVFAAGTTYRARVTLEAKEGYVFSNRYTPLVNDGVDCLVSGLSWSEDGKTLSFLVTFSATEAEPELPSDGTEDPDQDQGQGGGFPSSGGSGGSGYVVSGGTTAAVTTAETTSAAVETTAADSDGTVSAFTLASSDSMVISISVDELDINTIAAGQSAEITLDALDGESFEGTVTSVSSIGSTSGGSTQYTVSISFDATEEMKLGMNATATIITEEAADVLTLPVSALQQSGSEVFVYTALEEDGTLSGAVTVETGLSDGETVEIVSGLEEGQTVYYLRTVSASSDETGGMSFGGMEFGGGMDFGGGSMPDMGGSMPDFGGGGGGMPGQMGG